MSHFPQPPIVTQRQVLTSPKSQPGQRVAASSARSPPPHESKKAPMKSPAAASPSSTRVSVNRSLPEDWEADQDVEFCKSCSKRFSLLNRKHHCRNCGGIYCADCTKTRSIIKEKNYHSPVRVCGRCAFALNKNQNLVPNLQLKSQISASTYSLVFLKIYFVLFCGILSCSFFFDSEHPSFVANCFFCA